MRRSDGVMVSTLDFESRDPGSIPAGPLLDSLFDRFALWQPKMQREDRLHTSRKFVCSTIPVIKLETRERRFDMRSLPEISIPPVYGSTVDPLL